MAEPVKIPVGLDVAGTARFRKRVTFDSGLDVPADEIGDAQIKAAADIAETKVKQILPGSRSQLGTVSSDTIPAFIAQRAGTLKNFRAAVITKAVGDSTYTVDLHKNGVSVLTTIITLDVNIADRVSVTATIKSDGSENYVAGDFFEIVTVATVGTGTLPVDAVIDWESVTT